MEADKKTVKKLPVSLTNMPKVKPLLDVPASDAPEMEVEAWRRSPSAKHKTKIAQLARLAEANKWLTNRDADAITKGSMAMLREIEDLRSAPENNGQPAQFFVNVEVAATVMAMMAKAYLDVDKKAADAAARTGELPTAVRGVIELIGMRAAELLRQAAAENRPIV